MVIIDTADFGLQFRQSSNVRNGYAVAQVGLRSACIPAKDMNVKKGDVASRQIPCMTSEEAGVVWGT